MVSVWGGGVNFFCKRRWLGRGGRGVSPFILNVRAGNDGSRFWRLWFRFRKFDDIHRHTCVSSIPSKAGRCSRLMRVVCSANCLQIVFYKQPPLPKTEYVTGDKKKMLRYVLLQ